MLRLLAFLNLYLYGCHSTDEADTPASAPTCELDSCVGTAEGEGEGLVCCIAAHGYGIEDPNDLERLAARCTGEECDDTRYISEAAAMCVAQTCGLSQGIAGCNAWFQLGSSGASWVVENHTENCDGGGNLCGGGDFMVVDAETGECGEVGAWTN